MSQLLCRSQTTKTKEDVPEDPLEVFKEAACVALDAGMSLNDLMAVVEEAARGGAPVMRYRAWSPDGSMVDAPPPPVVQVRATPRVSCTVALSRMQDAANTISKVQLREVAERHGLSYERLLEDARRKGAVLTD